MNEAGGFREEGIPKLLPGLNFLHGLSNEDEETYELNFNFLKDLLDEGYLLRRINIRQVIPVPGFEKALKSLGYSPELVKKEPQIYLLRNLLETLRKSKIVWMYSKACHKNLTLILVQKVYSYKLFCSYDFLHQN